MVLPSASIDRRREKAAKTKAARQADELKVVKAQLKKTNERVNKLQGMYNKERQKNYRRLKRIGVIIEENKAFRKELMELRSSQMVGVRRQRIGKGPRAHLTTDAKALTLQAIDATGMAAERWKDLCGVLGNNLFSADQEVDLKGCSDRTVRRLLELDDMVCLLQEAEELGKQGEIRNLQLMCDISPLLGREYT